MNDRVVNWDHRTKHPPAMRFLPTLLVASSALLFNSALYAQANTWTQKSNLGDIALNGPAAREAGVGFSIGTKGYFGTASTTTDCTATFGSTTLSLTPGAKRLTSVALHALKPWLSASDPKGISGPERAVPG